MRKKIIFKVKWKDEEYKFGFSDIGAVLNQNLGEYSFSPTPVINLSKINMLGEQETIELPLFDFEDDIELATELENEVTVSMITKERDGYIVKINIEGLELGKGGLDTKEQAQIVYDNTIKVINYLKDNNLDITIDNYYKYKYQS